MKRTLKNLVPLFMVMVLVVLGVRQTPKVFASSPDFNVTSDWSDSIVGTPLDVSSQVLDAPAGKHGFVKAKSGHFYFDDGSRIKFWGTNLGYSGMFMSHENTDRTVNNLAALGYNAVRFNGIDASHVTTGIIDPKFIDSQHIDAVKQDELDYLFSRLKAKGIYISVTLHSDRMYKKNDGVVDWDIIGRNGAGYDLFDDRMIQLSKDFTNYVLTHVNPYTRLALKDDPVLALLEISNEDSFFPKWLDGTIDGTALKNNFTPFYRAELDKKYNQYLIDKYGDQATLLSVWGAPVSTVNLVKNGDFESDISDNWTTTIKNDLTLDSTLWSSSSPYKGLKNIKLNQITTKYTDATDGVLHQEGIKLKSGKTYKLSFQSRLSSGSATLKTRFENYDTKYSYGLDKNFTVTSSGWQLFTTTFTSNEDTTQIPAAALTFNFGWIWGDLEFDNVTLTEVQLKTKDFGESLDNLSIKRTPWADRFIYTPLRLRDMTEFYYSLLNKTFTDAKNYIVSLGVTVPVSATQNYSNNVELMARSSVDYTDNHMYWDHPSFETGKVWDPLDFKQDNKSLIVEGGKTAVNSRYWSGSRFFPMVALGRVEGKPFVVGEWLQAFPNDYQFELAPLITAYAQLQDWDGLFMFDYCGGGCTYGEDTVVEPWFNTYNNTQLLSQMQTSALSFIKGYVKPATKSVIIKYKNSDVIDRNLMKGYLWSFGTDIDRGLPVSALYNHRFSKAFNATSSSLAVDSLSIAEDQSLVTEKKHVSDTNELKWDVTTPGSENMVVDTPKSQSITGFITSKTLSSTNLKTTVTAAKYQYGSIALQPLDDLAIDDSKSMLLTVVSKKYNTGQVKNANNGLVSLGTAPVLMQPLDGEIEIKTNLKGVSSVTISRLNKVGQIISQIPVTLDTSRNKLTFTLDNLTSPYLYITKQMLP